MKEKLDKLKDVSVEVHYYEHGTGGNKKDLQHGSGGWRRVPPGYPHDTYRMGLTSGELFNVIPANQARELATGPNVTNNYITNNHFDQTVNTRASVGTVLQDYRAMQAIIGR